MNHLLEQFLNIFTTRELAIGFWLIIFLATCIFKFKLKTQICQTLKSIFNPLFIKIYFILFFYWIITTFLLYTANYWNISFLKDSIFWLLFVGVPFCFKVSQDKKYIKKIRDTLVDNLKVTAFLEAVINTYTFDFLTEFCIVPFVVILFTVNAFAATNEEYKLAKNFTDKIIYFIGTIICYYFLNAFWIHFADISNNHFVKSFFLPFFYTLFFIIPAVLLKMYSEYEWSFLYLISEKPIIEIYLKLRVFLSCGFNFIKLRNITNQLQISHSKLNSFSEVNQFLSLYSYREKLLPFDLTCKGFSPRKAIDYLKDEGLRLDNYKYIGSDMGFGEYLDVSSRIFSTGEALNYSIEGNNQEIQRLCLEFSELVYIGKEAQYYSYFVDVAKKLFEESLNMDIPKEVYEKLKCKKIIKYFYGNYKILLKKEPYPKRKGLACYQFIIRVKEPKTESEYQYLHNLD